MTCFPQTAEEKWLDRWRLDHQWFEHWPDQPVEGCPWCASAAEEAENEVDPES